MNLIISIVGILLMLFGLKIADNTIILILGAILLVVAQYLVYSNVIKAKNKVFEALSSIDVQLKKRYDLIPNILTIANKFMEHERGLLEEITKLRSSAVKLGAGEANLSQKIQLDKLIQEKMSQFMVAVENYPQLKSDQTMLVAMQTYNEVEEHICAARRFYNSAVNDLNNKVEIFPSAMYAKMLGVTKQQFFEALEIERQSINAANYLK